MNVSIRTHINDICRHTNNYCDCIRRGQPIYKDGLIINSFPEMEYPP